MDRKIIYAVVLSLITVLALNYFNPPVKPPEGIPQQVVPGQSYKVPTQQDLAKPVNREISFADTKRTQEEVIAKVETDRYKISFSSYGGVVSTLEFKKHKEAQGNLLKTVHYKTFYEQDQGGFLLAFDEKTPYFYQLLGTEEKADSVWVSFQAESEGWLIKKTFKVAKHSYQLSLAVELTPPVGEGISSRQPRILFPAPFNPEVTGDFQHSIVAGVGSAEVEKVAVGSELERVWVMPPLVGSENKYFAHALVKDEGHFTQRAFYKKVGHHFFTVLEGAPCTTPARFEMSFYCGPKLVEELNAVDNRLESLLSFGWLSWICKLLLNLLKLLYSFMGNYGFAIIVLTILVRIPFLPLTMAAKGKMEQFQKYQPVLNKIRQKYKDDVQMQRAEMMRFYKDHNISPAASVMGCLPFLVQIPILFGLYRVLSNYIELYHAPFFGWITDLSVKDPYYVLPVLMGVSMLWQQRMSVGTDSRQRVAMMFMTLLFTAFFISFPAGLVLYWAINNVLSVGEDYLRKLLVRPTKS